MLGSSIAQIALAAWRRNLPVTRAAGPTDLGAAWRRPIRCCPDCEYSWVASPDDATCMFCGGPGVPGRLDEHGGVRLRP